MRYVVVACLLLGACVPLVERSAKQCQEYGFKPGDQGFSNCVMTVSENHKAQVSRDLNDTGNALILQGAMMQHGYRP